MRVFCENSLILAQQIRDALESGDLEAAVSLMEDSRNFAALKTGSAEIAPIFYKYICREDESGEVLFNGCVKLLEKIVEVGLLDDITFQLCEFMIASNSESFPIILSNISKVLQRTPIEKWENLNWCLIAIQRRLSDCKIPEYFVESGSSFDDDIFLIELLYQDVLPFYDELISKYTEYFETNEDIRLCLIKFLIHLLAKPIGYVDLGPHNVKSRLRRMAEDIVKKMLSICNDPFMYLGMDEKKRYNPSMFAYGMFLHFLLDETVNYQNIPRIYSSCYIFRSSLVYIIKLLESYSNMVILKGFCTLEMLLRRTPKFSRLELELEANEELCKVFEKIISFNQDIELRQRALEVFKLYLYNFQPTAQYLLLMHLIHKIQHSGLAGYFTMQYKEILFNLQKEQSPEVIHFDGQRIYNFIKMCYGTINVDTLFHYDRIVSLVNLMRFAVIRAESKDTLRSVVRIWKTKFLNPLELSLAYLKLLLVTQKGKITNDADGIPEFESYFEIAEAISCLSKEEKIRYLDKTFTDVSMVENLVKGLYELVEEKLH